MSNPEDVMAVIVIVDDSSMLIKPREGNANGVQGCDPSARLYLENQRVLPVNAL